MEDTLHKEVLHFCSAWPRLKLNTKIGLHTHHHQPPPPQGTFRSAISQFLLVRWFWWNFKGRFLGTSRRDSNCQVGIFPSNICPGNICPCWEYRNLKTINLSNQIEILSKLNTSDLSLVDYYNSIYSSFWKCPSNCRPCQLYRHIFVWIEVRTLAVLRTPFLCLENCQT